MKLGFCVALFFAISTPAAPAAGPEFTLVWNGHTQKVSKKKYHSVEYDSRCFQNEIPICEAYKVNSQSGPLEIDKTILNFGAAYCSAVGGDNVTAQDSKQNQYGFCLFKDGSFFDSWSAAYDYQSRHKKDEN